MPAPNRRACATPERRVNHTVIDEGQCGYLSIWQNTYACSSDPMIPTRPSQEQRA
jgi:hypothetical protein